MKKKSLFLLLIALALLQFGASLGFSQTFTNGDWTYTLNASNEATITGYYGAGGDVVVPATLEGYPVKTLGAGYWSPVLPITNVVISDGIQTIGDWAFTGLTLTQITIPNTVESIGWKAFAYCGALTSVAIPSSVASISSQAFFGCSALTNIDLPTGLKSIGDGAFYRCAISNIIIPNTVTNIDTAAFQECFALTNLHIPSSVTRLGGGFAAGSPIGGISVDHNNTNYTSIDGVVFQANPSALIQYPGGKTGAYAIPNHVSRIARNAFMGSTINSLSVPNSIGEIEEFAFDYVASITNVSFAEGVTNIRDYAFRRTGLKSIVLPDSVRSIGFAAFECYDVTTVSIGSGLTNGGTQFWSPLLTNISVSPANLTYSSIDGVLYNKMQTEILRFPPGRVGPFSYSLPRSVTRIGVSAFYGSAGLFSIFLPETLADIGDWSFANCASLTSVTIEGAPSYLGGRAFDGCNSLTAVISLDNAPASISMPVFSENSSAIVYRLSNKSGWSNSFAGRPTALIDCLFTEQQFRDGASGYTSGRSQGRADVTTNPSAFNLFTQGQFNNNRAAGQSDVINNPTTYGLYTSNSIMDLRMGGLIVQRQGTNAVVSFQPQTTTDLTQPFTNNGTPITNSIPMPGNKGFIRINAKP